MDYLQRTTNKVKITYHHKGASLYFRIAYINISWRFELLRRSQKRATLT